MLTGGARGIGAAGGILGARRAATGGQLLADLGGSPRVTPGWVAERLAFFVTDSSLRCPRADLVHNRRERDAPSVFRPRRYFPMLCDAMFAAFTEVCASSPQSFELKQSLVFRMLSEKVIRIGQVTELIQSWMRVIEDNRRTTGKLGVPMHKLLLSSLPEACYQQFFQQLAKEPGQESVKHSESPMVLSRPKYALLSLLPAPVVTSQQFQYVLAHKLVLKTPINDFFVWRVVVDSLMGASTALFAIFDAVLEQWSQSDFASSTDYALNASVTFFLRYAMNKMIESEMNDFDGRDWTAKLCKGVQDHMSHSVERVRTLGMRVGETLSKLLSPEKALDFGIAATDPLTLYGQVDTTIGMDATLPILTTENQDEKTNAGAGIQSGGRRRYRKKRQQTAFSLDPDAVVMSDDEEAEDLNNGNDSGEDNGESDADSDSDMSLDAYDLDDDERDLQAKRPMYLKDLISALMAEDDREKTEAALEEAERLLRRRPRDLHENVREVVTALLRLEDKYSTDNFVALRANALSAACTLSPAKTLPYFLSQALEREQLLQSRLDILQAMVRASHELSETGEYRLSGPKSLLQAPRSTSDLDAATMASFKTRRFGYRRDPLAPVKKNAFGPHALSFFSPLLFGYVEYRQKLRKKELNDVEHIFLAHLLHALASFVEAAGNSPQTVSMAKCLVEFAWVERDNKEAAVRRQVLFSVSRVLLVVPPFLLRQELGESIVEVLTWLQQVARRDPDDGCREASRLLLSSSNIPMLALQ